MPPCDTLSFIVHAVPKRFFVLPEFPPPPELNLEEYPTGASLGAYVKAYAERFDLVKHVAFGARVSPGPARGLASVRGPA